MALEVMQKERAEEIQEIIAADMDPAKASDNVVEEEIKKASEQVVKKSDVDNDSGKYDAKEKGKNEYRSDGKVKIKKKDGSRLVVDENPDGKGLFDVSI